MNQERFCQIIKDIRKKNNLTQKDLAEKYNVTAQAVSKWENGKNLPDIILIKHIAKDFNYSLDTLFADENIKKEKNNKKKIIIITSVLISLIIIILIIGIIIKREDFKFKTLSSNCNDFSLSGSIAYNNNKSAIYITNITYCGEEQDNTLYDEIECVLYESDNDIDKKISSYLYENSITLDEFLRKVTFTIDNYKNTCEDYANHKLYLSIIATKDNKKVTYRIPLTMDDSCSGD